jgi:hypothetical protein
MPSLKQLKDSWRVQKELCLDPDWNNTIPSRSVTFTGELIEVLHIDKENEIILISNDETTDDLNIS